VITYPHIDQKSEQWQILRAGIPTASEFDRILRVYNKKTGEQTAENLNKIKTYATRKVAEIYLKRPIQKELFTRSMEFGSIQEETAVRLYEMTYKLKTETVGFITDDNGHYGCSPDRLVGDDGLLEVKAPDEDTHMGYLLDPQSLVDRYWHQSQGQLHVCTDREWVDMYSFNPEMPPVVSRVYRDTAYQQKLSDDLAAFRNIMGGMILNLQEKGYIKL
jgi:hypothetical protein